MQLCYMQFWEYFNEICILHLPNKTVFLGIYIYRRSRHWCLSQFDWNLFSKVGEWYCNNSKTYDNKSFGLENIFPLDSRALFLDVHLGKQLYDHPKHMVSLPFQEYYSSIHCVCFEVNVKFQFPWHLYWNNRWHFAR